MQRGHAATRDGPEPGETKRDGTRLDSLPLLRKECRLELTDCLFLEFAWDDFRLQLAEGSRNGGRLNMAEMRERRTPDINEGSHVTSGWCDTVKKVPFKLGQ